MKQIFEQYAAYHFWANQRMIDAIKLLPEKMVEHNIVSSFSSLRLTLLHMLNAENIWWQRLKLVETVKMDEYTDSSTDEIAVRLMEQSKQWKDWIEKNTAAALEHEFIYRNSKKQQFKQSVYQMLLHVFNHATYHRGQLVTMLRQSGVETIPSTDFIAFTRGQT